MPPGRKREISAGAFSAPATVYNCQRAEASARGRQSRSSRPTRRRSFLCVKRRYLFGARPQEASPEPIRFGTGGKAQKSWVFRLSELAASIVRNETSIPKPQKPCVRSDLAVPAESEELWLISGGSLKKSTPQWKGRPGCLDTGSQARTARRVEHNRNDRTCPGIFRGDKDAWREVDRLGLGVRKSTTLQPTAVLHSISLAEQLLEG